MTLLQFLLHKIGLSPSLQLLWRLKIIWVKCLAHGREFLILFPCVILARVWWLKRVTLVGFLFCLFIFTRHDLVDHSGPFMYSFQCDFILTWSWDTPSYELIYLIFTIAYEGLSQGHQHELTIQNQKTYKEIIHNEREFAYITNSRIRHSSTSDNGITRFKL